MEYFGIFAFILSLYYGGKIKKLKRQMKRLEKSNEGDTFMSQLIKNMVNKSGKIYFDSEVLGTVYEWTILEVDGEWVKIQRMDKKGKIFTKIVRIDDIKSIDIEEE